MLKKLLYVFAIATALVINFDGPAFAAESNNSKIRVAVILDEINMIQGSYESAEPVSSTGLYPIVQNALNKIFNNKPEYDIQPIEETAGYALTYRQNNGLLKYGDFRDKSTQTIMAGLKKEDMNIICKYFGVDYLVYAYIQTIKAPLDDKSAVNLISGSIVKLKIWSNKNNDFTEFTGPLMGYTVLKEYNRSSLNDRNIAILKNDSRAIETEVWAKIANDASKIRKTIKK